MGKRPEILAPVANLEMAQAAVHNGAGAIYVGFPGFNARGRTNDLDPQAFAELATFCRFYGVKVYVALNVLVFESELGQLLETARTLIGLGIDAFIVQDLGVARMLRHLHGKVRLHASTQMTVTAPEAVALTEDLQLARYVLARELSLEEIAAVRRGTDKELEVFVHGALCVSYSGQCLTSESFGGRSANRGQCAQSCRLDYDLLVDGEKRDLGEKRYLVSPQDLCGLDEVAALAEIGIESLKIEGRLKTSAYVAATAKAYSEAVAAHGAPNAKSDLAITYSRGFFPGWLHGVDHQGLVPATYGHHRGRLLGPVLRRESDALVLAKNQAEEADSRSLQPGDGMLFLPTAGTPSDQGVAGRIYEVEASRDGVKLRFERNLPVQRIESGWLAYWNDSPSLERELTVAVRDREAGKRVPVRASVTAAPGEPFSLTLSDGISQVTVTGEELLTEARNAPLTVEQVSAELESMQAEGFALAGLDAHFAAPVFLHGKALRKLRQEAVTRLKAVRLTLPTITFRPEVEVKAWVEGEATRLRENTGPLHAPRLHLLLREAAQVQALVDGTKHQLGVHTVYLDFEYGRDYRNSLQLLRDAGFSAGLATTRIMKPLEKHNITVIEKLRPDAVLVRNLAALQALRNSGLPLIGDFSLNAANSLTAGYLLGKGLQRLTPSYDLNQSQLLDLIGAAGGRHFEVTVHQFLPAFHMEHCVFAAFLSKGHSFRDCGKPCEHHRIALRDPTGAEHPVKADQECRNTMFHGTAQSSARLIPQMRAAGVQDFRVELLWEDAATLVKTVGCYRDLLTDARPAQAIYTELRVGEKYGVSEGQLRNDSVWKNRKKED